MNPTVVLFDIDGTLVSCGGAGRKALCAAFRELHGKDDVLDFAFGGLTDRAIVRMGLRAANALDDDAAIDRLIERYLSHLPALVAQSSAYRVLPGVVPLLLRLADESRVALGLGTGNVKSGAFTKLARGGLGDYFGFGGFGCDHEDRRELIAIGARRGAERLGVGVGDCRVIVVGDTPRDVAAAHAIGARCLAVATGDHDQRELAQAGADWVVTELSLPAAEQAISGR